MLEQGETHECWVAHFDILGFRSILVHGSKDFKTILSQIDIDEIIESIKDMPSLHREHIEYLFYADTFIFYSKSDQIQDYPSMLSVAQRFIRKCISIRLPVRGAISFGELIFGHEKRILMGKAFLESYEYSEDQKVIIYLTNDDRISQTRRRRDRAGAKYFCRFGSVCTLSRFL